MSRNPHDLPSHGQPGQIREKKDAASKVIQKRFYGIDGRAIKNIDYGHDHTGAGDPHAHDWDWSKNPPRQAPRSLEPGEA